MATFFGKNKNIDKNLEKKFNPTDKTSKLAWFDDENELGAISTKDMMKPKYTFEYKKLVGYSIFSNEKEIKSKSGIGRAVGGGVLFGPTGAIVGAVTGKKDGKQIISQLLLVAHFEYNGKIKKESIPYVLSEKLEIGSLRHKKIEQDLEHVMNKFDEIMENR